MESDFPNEESFKLEQVFKKRIVPLVKEMDKDFFKVVDCIDNAKISMGLNTIATGFRIMIKNPEYRKFVDKKR